MPRAGLLQAALAHFFSPLAFIDHKDIIRQVPLFVNGNCRILTDII
jgi:hypothetical protein